LSLNVMYTAYSGALTDLVNEKQRGIANGLMGAFSVLGASAGFGCFSTFLELSTSYPLFATMLSIVVLISLWAYTEETPAMRRERRKRRRIDDDLDDDESHFMDTDDEEEDWTWKEIRQCYWIDRSEHYDFYLVFVSRTLYYMGISAQTFMLFYFRDVIRSTEEGNGNAKADVSNLALIGQLTGGIVCIPLGRKVLIYLSSLTLAVSYCGLAFIARDMKGALLFGAIYGIGNGTYLSVDYALACDTLPSKEKAARYLGIWGVGAFIGTLFGPLLIGPALILFGDRGVRDPISGVAEYAIPGYIAILMIGSACILFGAFLVSFIRSTT